MWEILNGEYLDLYSCLKRDVKKWFQIIIVCNKSQGGKAYAKIFFSFYIINFKKFTIDQGSKIINLNLLESLLWKLQFTLIANKFKYYKYKHTKKYIF